MPVIHTPLVPAFTLTLGDDGSLDTLIHINDKATGAPLSSVRLSMDYAATYRDEDGVFDLDAYAEECAADIKEEIVFARADDDCDAFIRGGVS